MGCHWLRVSPWTSHSLSSHICIVNKSDGKICRPTDLSHVVCTGLARTVFKQKKNWNPLPTFTNCRFHMKIQISGNTESAFLYCNDGLKLSIP